ncbi:MAG: MFS transporter [Pseudomonadota bacterium]
MKKIDGKILSPASKIVAFCFSIQAIGIGSYISFGVFFNPLMAEFGWSRAVISGSSSMAFFISGLFAIYIGRLNDRVGPKMILTITAVFLGAGLMMMSGVHAIWQLYLMFGLVFGIGLSSIDVIALTTIARWFPEKRGAMTGIVKVGTGAGQLLFPFLASVLIAWFGWRNAYLVLGIVCLILLSMIARGMKRDPGELCQDEKISAEGKARQSETLAASVCSKKPEVFSKKMDLTFSQAFGTTQLWLLCAINFTIVSCMMSILVHIVPHSRDAGVSVYKAASVLSAIGGVSMAGRFVIGMIIDRIGSKRSMLLSLFILVMGLSWLQTADTLWKLYVFAGIYGLAHGGFFTVISPIVAELFGIRSHGSIFGLVVCFGTTGGAAGPFMTGYLFDLSGSYYLAFSLMLMLGILGIGMLSFLKPVKPVPPIVEYC